MALKFLDANGSGSDADAVSAILYAADEGVQIMSNSWGGTEYDQALADAITYADSTGALFVAVAGNDATGNDSSPHYPRATTTRTSSPSRRRRRQTTWRAGRTSASGRSTSVRPA